MTEINPWLQRSGLDQQLGFLLGEASMAVWGDLRSTLAAAGLKPQSYAALLIVGTSPGCKQQDVAHALGIQRPNLVALIDGLVTQGLIERAVNAADRRSYALTLTPAGQALLAKGREVHLAHEERLATAIAGADHPQLIAILHKLGKL